MDASPPAPLRREVESPRTVGLVGPFLALSASAMLTIMSAVAVLARPPHTPPAHPRTQIDAPTRPAAATAPRGSIETCRQRVYRASPDGRAEQFEDCAAVVR